MRTTVDIADDVYADLKAQAAAQRTSVRALINAAIYGMRYQHQVAERARAASRPSWPTIEGGDPDALAKIDNDAIFGLDDE